MKNQRNEIRNWLDRDDWMNWYAVTLTMRQSRKLPEGILWLDEMRASRNLRYFLNRLNKKFFGKSFERHNKRINVIPAYECDKEKKLHYHLIIAKPNHVASDDFINSLVPLWMKTPWGLWSADVQSEVDSKWLKYITKQTTKDPNNESSKRFGYENVDFENLWIVG